MRVDGFSVQMGSQSYSYKSLSMQASQTTTLQQNFGSDTAQKTEAITAPQTTNKQDDSRLVQGLSASLLKSISDQSRIEVRDRVEFSSTYIEAAAISFSTTAYVKAGDKEIALQLDVSLARSFVQQMNFTQEQIVALQDPLVLQLDGQMPTLSSKTFAFDIDSDGEKDQISKLGAGSAFLALDKNSNGRIDNGNELLGASSGDGFGDLAQYDDDKNGWIDENDKIFDKLRVWKKTDGEDELVALGQVGIGAIFLGNVSTQFELKTGTNQQLGNIRSSGFFLFENGKAGVVSQVDLVKFQEPRTQESVGALQVQGLENKRARGLAKYNKAKEDEGDDSSVDKRMDKLQKQLRRLEAKLAQAQKEEKPQLQVQIGALYSQMMSLLSSIKE